MIAQGLHLGTQVIQEGVRGYFENGACYKIINFWSVYSSVIPLELLNFGHKIPFWNDSCRVGPKEHFLR